MRLQIAAPSTGGPGLTIWDCLVLAAIGPFGYAALIDITDHQTPCQPVLASGMRPELNLGSAIPALKAARAGADE